MRSIILLMVVLSVMLSVGVAKSLEEFQQEVKNLQQEYIQSARSPEVLEKIKNYLDENDMEHSENYEYLLLKTKLLYMIDDYKTGRKIFDSIPNSELKEPFDLVNRLSDYLDNKKDIREAAPLIHKLAESKPDLLDNWIMTSLSQQFHYYTKPESEIFATAKKRLDILMGLLNDAAKKHFMDLYIWTEIVIHSESNKKITVLLRKHKKTIKKMDFRFKLLSVVALARHPENQELAEKLLKKYHVEIKKIIVKSDKKPIKASEKDRLLFFYSCSSYYQALEMAEKKSNEKAKRFYKESIESLLKISEKRHYFYDEFYFPGIKKFSTNYIAFVKSNYPQEDALRMIAEYAVRNTTIIPVFTQEYKNSGTSEPIYQFWMKVLDSSLPIAPDFTIIGFDDTTYSLRDYHGRWLCLDFWGVWCSPCVNSLPSVQAFYSKKVQSSNNEIALMTINCFDEPTKVKAFLENNAYTFPVAKYTDELLKAFGIKAYPTKFLITPTGRIIEIPHTLDFDSALSLYMLKIELPIQSKE